MQMERQEALKDLNEREKEVRDTCKAKSEDQAVKFLTTKEGRNLIRQNAIKIVEHSEFRVKMDKKAAEKGMVRISKKDAQAQAIKDYKEELYMKNVQSASEEYRKLQEELEDQNTKDDDGEGPPPSTNIVCKVRGGLRHANIGTQWWQRCSHCSSPQRRQSEQRVVPTARRS